MKNVRSNCFSGPGAASAATTNLFSQTTQFSVAEDIVDALKAEASAWSNFLAFPDLYRRVRVGYIEDARKDRREFERRLGNFVRKTSLNQMFGNWNDGDRLG
jgi:hypothetical protein